MTCRRSTRGQGSSKVALSELCNALVEYVALQANLLGEGVWFGEDCVSFVNDFFGYHQRRRWFGFNGRSCVDSLIWGFSDNSLYYHFFTNLLELLTFLLVSARRVVV